MARKMALSAVGRDCPGIVAAVSKVLFEHGCNIEDSSMTILRGEFAMILIVSVEESRDLEALSADLGRVEKQLNLILSFRELPGNVSADVSGSPGVPFIVSVYGADKPGIVYSVTKLLADNGVNITDVETKIVGSPATPVYIMILEVEIPTGAQVEEKLAALAKELSVDITLRHYESMTL